MTETQLGLRQYIEHVAGKVEGVLGFEPGTATGAGLELLRGTEYLVARRGTLFLRSAVV